jgi:hypothetical protein
MTSDAKHMLIAFAVMMLVMILVAAYCQGWRPPWL